MRKSGIIWFDIAMAVVLFILYAPNTLALSPFDPDPMRAILAVVLGVIVIALLIRQNVKAFTKVKYAYFDTNGDLAAKDIIKALENYTNKQVIGGHARSGIAQLNKCEHKMKNIEGLLSSKFQEGSITYDKFVGAVDSAEQTILRNTALLANKVQAFDVTEYSDLSRAFRTGSYLTDGIPNEVQVQKMNLAEANLADMQNVVSANERLLVEMEKFAQELSLLENNANAEKNNIMLEEIQTLVAQTKYYQ